MNKCFLNSKSKWYWNTNHIET